MASLLRIFNSYLLFILVLSCRKNVKRMGLKMLNKKEMKKVEKQEIM